MKLTEAEIALQRKLDREYELECQRELELEARYHTDQEYRKQIDDKIARSTRNTFEDRMNTPLTKADWQSIGINRSN